jgi:hypothetical protein
MATKISGVDESLTKTSQVGGKPQDYEPCLVKIIGMKLFEKADTAHDNPLIQKFDNVIEIELGVQDGEYKGEKLSLCGFAKTKKGDWACYPSINGGTRPILREVLDSVREYEKVEELEDRVFDFAPSELMNRCFILGIKKVEKDGDTFWITETDYQRQKDEVKAEEYKQKKAENDDIQASAASVVAGEDAVKPEDLPF